MIAFALPSQFRVYYRPGTHCPACAHTGWLVGRTSAECARCATVLPLPQVRDA